MSNKRLLSLDAGKRNCGLAYVKYKSSDGNGCEDVARCKNWKSYEIKWMYLIDLNVSDPNDLIDSNAIFYPEMQQNVSNLRSVPNHAYLKRKLAGKCDPNRKIDFCTEQVEGVSDPNVLYHLMRVNFVSGFFCGMISGSPRAGQINVLPKNAKWGWSSINKIANILCGGKFKQLSLFHERVYNHRKFNTLRFPGKREGILKKCKSAYTLKTTALSTLKRNIRKILACDIVRYMVLTSDKYDESMKKWINQAGNEQLNHIADAILQAMWLIRKQTMLEYNRSKNSEYNASISKISIKNTLCDDMINDILTLGWLVEIQ